MTHQEIQSLLLRYREGKCRPEETAKIHQWYNRLNKDSTLSLSIEDLEESEERLLNNIWTGIREEGSGEEETLPVRSWWKTWGMYSAAASLALVIGLFFITKKPASELLANTEVVVIHVKRGKLVRVKNETKRDKKITLEDNSIVLLAPGSTILYPETFLPNRREVQLEGDAFFEIAKNRKRPFCVYSGKLIAKVLGTSFRLTTHPEDQELEVQVMTGKVSVFENHELFRSDLDSDHPRRIDNGVILTPNQKAIYFSESRQMITGIVDQPKSIPAEKPRTAIFNNSPLMNIFTGLQSEYGIEIVVANEDLEKCSFTGDLSELSLFDKLDLICKSNNTAYEVIGARILITGAGCQERANI